MPISIAQRIAIAKLAEAGAVDKPVRWYGIVRTGTMQALAREGLLISGDGKNTCEAYDISREVRLAPRAVKLTTAPEKQRGTCQCCFGKHVIDPSKTIHNHGWREYGNRRVGEYGNVEHAGRCYGVGYLPFEQDHSRTEWYLTEILLATKKGTAQDLAKARDPKHAPQEFSVRKFVGVQNGRLAYEYVPVRNVQGDDDASCYERDKYEEALSAHIDELEGMLRDVEHEIATVKRKLAEKKKKSSSKRRAS